MGIKNLIVINLKKLKLIKLKFLGDRNGHGLWWF